MKNQKSKTQIKNIKISKKTLNFYVFLFVFLIFGLWSLVYNVSSAHAQVSEKELGEYLNQERTTHGLDNLNFDFSLHEAAQKKAEDMISNNYFEHYSPFGKSPWDFIRAAGYDYKLAGENLAMDFSNSSAVHDAWMASRTHKENILNPNYENFAIAKLNGKIDNKDTTVIVEMFGKKDKTLNGKINGLFTSVANYLLGYQNLFK